jgi:hypothetical protein
MPAAGWKACPTSDTTRRAQEKQTTENTEKTNHGGYAKKQTTEGTENTEIGKEGAG